MASVCRDFSLVISTEKSLTEKVRMFRDKCTNLEAALEGANKVSGAEIRALKREIAHANDKNDNLTNAYDELKKQHEATLHDREKELEKVKAAMNKQLRESEKKRKDAVALVKELEDEIARLKEDFEDKEKRLNELVGF